MTLTIGQSQLLQIWYQRIHPNIQLTPINLFRRSIQFVYGTICIVLQSVLYINTQNETHVPILINSLFNVLEYFVTHPPLSFLKEEQWNNIKHNFQSQYMVQRWTLFSLMQSISIAQIDISDMKCCSADIGDMIKNVGCLHQYLGDCLTIQH